MRALHIALKDLRQVLRERLAALFLVVMPIAFTLFMGAIFRFEPEGDARLEVGVWFGGDADHPVHRVLNDLLASSEAVRPVPLADEEAQDAERLVAEDDLAGALLVPAGAGQAWLAGEDAGLRAVLEPATAEGRVVQSALDMATTRAMSIVEAARVSADAYAEREGFASEADRQQYLAEALAAAADAWREPPAGITVRATGKDDPAAETQEAREQAVGAPTGYAQSSPGIMVQFAAFGLMTSAGLVVVERNSGTLRRLLTTPASLLDVAGGHLLAMFAIVAMQQVILVLFGQIALDLDYLRAPAATLVMIAALSAFSAGLGLFIGVMARGEDQVTMYSLIAMFVLSAMGGAWFPLDITGQTFSRIGHLLPSAWAMDGYQNIIMRGQGLGSVLTPAAVIVGWAALFLWLSVWQLRARSAA